MKTKLCYLISLISICYLNAQTTFDLNWERFALSPATDLTIDVGDTVRWTWTDAFPHTVVSNVGSTETFSSAILTGIGMTYSYTFTQVGVNPYFCDIHGAANMSGIITVNPVFGIENNPLESFRISPNPSKTLINLEFSKNITNASVVVYDLTGKQIYFKETITNKTLDISTWPMGVYFIRVSDNDYNKAKTKRIVKN